MMSTPGWSASGNASPQSISNREPANSTTAQLRPISPRPPRKAILAGSPAASTARSATRTLARVQADASQQAAHELDLWRRGVEQRWAQWARRQPQQVQPCLQEDRAGGGEQALEQLQVPCVQLQRRTGVAALERLHQLLECRADQVGRDADHADPTDRQQRQDVLDVTRVLLNRSTGVPVHAAGIGHVADRVLHAHDVVDLGEPEHRRDLDLAAGPPGNVVEQAGQPRAPGDGAEVEAQARLRRLVVVGGDQQQRAGAGLLRELGQLDRLGGRIGRGASHHPAGVPRRLDHGGPQAALLVMGQRGRLACGASDHQRVGAVVQQVPRQALRTPEVEGAVGGERRRHRGEHATEASRHVDPPNARTNRTAVQGIAAPTTRLALRGPREFYPEHPLHPPISTGQIAECSALSLRTARIASMRSTDRHLQTVLRPRLQVDLGLTLWPLRRGTGDPSMRAERPAVWWRATRTPDGPATARYAARAGEIEVLAWGPGAEWCLASALDLLGARDDVDGFAPDGLIGRLHRAMPGLRISRSQAVFEALVPTILEQKVAGIEARRSYRGMLRAWGTPAPGPPAPGRGGPRPLLLPPVEAHRLLQALPGVGPWTSAEVALIALGDADAVPVGDLHLPHMVSWALAGEPRGTDERMLELLTPYAGQRGRVIRLLARAGQWAPRFGPRMPARSFNRI